MRLNLIHMLFPQIHISWTIKRCQMWHFWWRENLFMLTRCCFSQHQRGKGPNKCSKLMYIWIIKALLKKLFLLFPPIRFKSLLSNRPAAENTCIEISHVKYNIFQVGMLLPSHALNHWTGTWPWCLTDTKCSVCCSWWCSTCTVVALSHCTSETLKSWRYYRSVSHPLFITLHIIHLLIHHLPLICLLYSAEWAIREDRAQNNTSQATESSLFVIKIINF